MQHAANSPAFVIPPPSLKRQRLRSRCTTPLRVRPRMAVAPLPDDTALDMVSFALSGPGVIAAGAFVTAGLAALFSFAEIGPRKRTPPRTSFFLRLSVDRPIRAELTDGSVRSLRVGENVLRMGTYEECTAVARQLPDVGVNYSIYKAVGESMLLLATHPRPVDAEGASWPKGVVSPADEQDIAARWEEYERVGEDDDSNAINQEWQRLVSGFSTIQFESSAGSGGTSDCRLCGGTGFTRCHRCGGASASSRVGATFVCDCEHGRRACDWCNREQ